MLNFIERPFKIEKYRENAVSLIDRGADFSFYFEQGFGHGVFLTKTCLSRSYNNK